MLMSNRSVIPLNSSNDLQIIDSVAEINATKGKNNTTVGGAPGSNSQSGDAFSNERIQE